MAAAAARHKTPTGHWRRGATVWCRVCRGYSRAGSAGRRSAARGSSRQPTPVTAWPRELALPAMGPAPGGSTYCDGSRRALTRRHSSPSAGQEAFVPRVRSPWPWLRRPTAGRHCRRNLGQRSLVARSHISWFTALGGSRTRRFGLVRPCFADAARGSTPTVGIAAAAASASGGTSKPMMRCLPPPIPWAIRLRRWLAPLLRGESGEIFVGIYSKILRCRQP